MPSNRYEQVTKYLHALDVRKAELESAREAEKRAIRRRVSFETAVSELEAFVRKLVGEEPIPESELPPAAGAPPEELEPEAPAPEGSIASRALAFLDASKREHDAKEVSDAIGANLEATRTALSKLFLRGAIHRPKPGIYRSLLPRRSLT
jgi:hypothetical protein